MTRKFNWRISVLLTIFLLIGLLPANLTVNAAATSGTLTFKVQTVTYSGRYSPKNVGAIWIQDSSGKFVKSLKVWANAHISSLSTWRTSSGSNKVDAITSATISTHQIHTVTWNCTDTSGAVVNDGTYRIYVEFSETNSVGQYTYFEFNKGTTSVNMSPANQTYFTNINISYQPAASTPTPTNTPTKPSNTPTPTTPSFTPIKTTAFWSFKTAMTNSKSSFGTAAIGNKIYLAGGYKQSTGECLGSLDVYDVLTDTWTSVSQEMPTKRYALGLAAVNNKLYAIGGTDDNGTCLAVVEEFDPSTGIWKSRNPMSNPRSNFGIAVVGNLIYVLGGFNDQTGQYINTVEQYNPATNQWISMSAKMPTPRSGIASAVVDGKIYTIGGYGYKDQSDVILGNTEVYDTTLNTWSTKASLKNPRADLGAAVINGKIYAAGGVGFNSSTLSVETLGDLEEYDTTNDIWTNKGGMKVKRSTFGISSSNGKAYLFGGMGTNSLEISEVEELSILTGNVTPPPTQPSSIKGYSLKGYVIPDFNFSIKTASLHKSDFKIEVVGTSFGATTDINGYFEIKGIPAGVYSIKINKANYLSRTMDNISINNDTLISSEASPLSMWAGDVEINGTQDGKINMSDIIEIGKCFNATIVDANFNENVDFNFDGAINMSDIIIMARHFNSTSANY